MGIGKRIEAAMERAGKRPVDIARFFNITESAVSQWFQKDKGPKTERLGDLAGFLDTTTDFFIRNIETPAKVRGFSEPSAAPPTPPKTLFDVLTKEIYDPDAMTPEEEQAVLVLQRYLRRAGK